jgi:hypothetical protein
MDKVLLREAIDKLKGTDIAEATISQPDRERARVKDRNWQFLFVFRRRCVVEVEGFFILFFFKGWGGGGGINDSKKGSTKSYEKLGSRNNFLFSFI